MAYTLYYNPDSANIVVRMAMEELELDYEDRLVPRRRSDRDEDFLRLNPRGLLPLVIDQEANTALFETAAILLYLADKHSSLAPKPTNLKARGEFLKWLFMLSNTVHADLRMRFYTERYTNTDEEIAPLLLANRKRIQAHFQLINRILGKHSGDWFLEDQLSVCDFYLGSCFRWAQVYPAENPAIDIEDLKSLPNLVGTLRKLQQRPSVQRAFAREGINGNAFVDVVPHLPTRAPDRHGADAF